MDHLGRKVYPAQHQWRQSAPLPPVPSRLPTTVPGARKSHITADHARPLTGPSTRKHALPPKSTTASSCAPILQIQTQPLLLTTSPIASSLSTFKATAQNRPRSTSSSKGWAGPVHTRWANSTTIWEQTAGITSSMAKPKRKMKANPGTRWQLGCVPPPHTEMLQSSEAAQPTPTPQRHSPKPLWSKHCNTTRRSQAVKSSRKGREVAWVRLRVSISAESHRCIMDELPTSTIRARYPDPTKLRINTCRLRRRPVNSFDDDLSGTDRLLPVSWRCPFRRVP